MRVGRSCEISTIIDVVAPHVSIGDESFFATASTWEALGSIAAPSRWLPRTSALARSSATT